MASKERQIVVIDDRVVLLVAGNKAVDAVAQQGEPFDVLSVTGRYERNWVTQTVLLFGEAGMVRDRASKEALDNALAVVAIELQS